MDHRDECKDPVRFWLEVCAASVKWFVIEVPSLFMDAVRAKYDSFVASLRQI